MKMHSIKKKNLNSKEHAKFIGNSLKMAREYKKLTFKDVAEKINISSNLITKVEEGEADLYLEDFIKICNLYNVDVDKLSLSFNEVIEDSHLGKQNRKF